MILEGISKQKRTTLRSLLSRPCSVIPVASFDTGNSSFLLDNFTRFCYLRDLPRAMKAMDGMQRLGIHADSITYSELIKCCLARGAVEDSKFIHKHVFPGGFAPETFFVNTFLNMYARFNLLKKTDFVRPNASKKYCFLDNHDASLQHCKDE